MDWKYKHFNREAVFQASGESVLEAARAVAAQAFARIDNAPDGFVAHAHGAWHAANATFRVEPAADGTRLAVELLVERAAGRGFMLVDIGGYYDGQINKWLSGISQRLGQGPISMPDLRFRRGCFTGCFVWFLVGVVLTLVALPLDSALFHQAPGSPPGPFISLASMIGLLAGVGTFLYVMVPDASIWKSVRERLPGTRKE